MPVSSHITVVDALPVRAAFARSVSSKPGAIMYTYFSHLPQFYRVDKTQLTPQLGSLYNTTAQKNGTQFTRHDVNLHKIKTNPKTTNSWHEAQQPKHIKHKSM